MGKDILYNYMNFPDRAAAHAQCASACTLCVATMEAMTRLERLGLARTLRVVAVVVVARLAQCAWWLWLGSHNARAVGGAAGALDTAEGNTRY